MSPAQNASYASLTCNSGPCMQTGRPDRGQRQAIPDQHALDMLVSSSTLPAWLDGQACPNVTSQRCSRPGAQLDARPHWHVSYIQLALCMCAGCCSGNADAADGLQAVGDLADIDAKTAKLLATLLQPFLSIGILLMVVRIVLSWYPQVRPLPSVQQQCTEHSLLRAHTACVMQILGAGSAPSITCRAHVAHPGAGKDLSGYFIKHFKKLRLICETVFDLGWACHADPRQQDALGGGV